MASKSYANILDLDPDKLLDIPQTPRALPRVMTIPGIIAGVDSYGNDCDSESTSSSCRERKIIVANMLPLHIQRDPDTLKLTFSFDEDSLLWQLKDGFSPESEVVYIGSLKVEVDAREQEEVAQKLLDEYNCVPTFLPYELHRKFYGGFCKHQLWPLFHYMLPMCPDHADRFDRVLWKAYVSANKIFADKVMEVANPEDDYIWVHDYHLMILPTFLRNRCNRVKLGFFLHSPFPSSEIYRTLPVRDEILKGLLNCDLIGFHTFDYARHFLSCCSRMMGLDYESKRGHIGLDYFGRTVYIKILPVGIHMGRLESVLNLPITLRKVKEIAERFKGKKLIVGVDDMDIFKGISLKLLAFEYLLQMHPALRDKLVLIQIVNPARSAGKDVQEAKMETYLILNRINEAYGSPDYQPVVLIDRPVARYEKSAYYSMADCCIVNAVRDGMNLVPYKYIVCRQNSPHSDDETALRTSMLVVSEFVGCSPSLSGAIRVNPWDIESVAVAINSAIIMKESEKQLRHAKHYRKLSPDCIVSAYRRSNRRAIFLDYDGTLVPHSSIVKTPSPELITILNTLCDDPKNTVFIVSGRGKGSLSEWLAPCARLGVAAEHGYFIRWSRTSDWQPDLVPMELEWKEIAKPVMELYREATDGSTIEIKESGLVWHHQDADPDFGSCQAKELLVHLENVLANEPAVVKRGRHIVEVKPQGVSKGLVAEKVLSTMTENGEPLDFVTCIGDDRSDEDMFESIMNTVSSAEIFACTVGRKPSKARYYLDDTVDVVRLLAGLANASDPKPSSNPARFHVTFDTGF
ncbi:probable alpha,alpha-trehalose-phosphate synthase [UDP-forming] 10 isoform X2 [Cynara cardunculus var. scolymus]|uniref:probable alpha,alpha-trehalose-phosphate synthase [UDP-forming] 10 isoform X2 n=1 Tax=Cynara cardunculus var. scolymus TaxID=59895 RepID=UPI000D62CD8B|nr:probable alpha,alpha-trehalose-phosphate synthase [UDP-forming] 10 isoform X2 [Cynara cardunculus var. scolymus]